MLDPETNARARVLETGELRARQELLPERRPEAFDFAERHRMLRPALEVRDAILLQLRLEAAGAAPGGILATIVGEHLLGRLELGDRLPIHFDDRLGRRTAEQIRADEEPRIIIQEGHHVRIAPAQPERENIRLPHLIGRGPLEEPRPRQVAPARCRRWGHQVGLVKFLPHRLRTGGQEEHSPQPLRDTFDAPGRVVFFELDDPVSDRLRQTRPPGRVRRGVAQPRLPERLITLGPISDRMHTQAKLGGDGGLAEPLFQVQLHRPKLQRKRIALAG